MNRSNKGLLIAITALLAALVAVLIVLIIVLVRQQPQQSQQMQQTQQTAPLSTTAATPETRLPEEQIEHAVDEQKLDDGILEPPVQETLPPINDRTVFAGILRAIHDDGEYDGMTFEKLSPEDGEVGEFAVIDVDRDGKEELIVLWNDTFMAGMLGVVYGTDTAGNVIQEYCNFPALTFYGNGIIEAGISHNQGLAGAFWPYSFSRYDAASDTYIAIGSVDAWDRSLAETDYENNVYPAYADTSNTGLVYYINDPDYAKCGEPVDVTEYEEWHRKLLGGSSEIIMDFLPLTNENIRALTS